MLRQLPPRRTLNWPEEAVEGREVSSWNLLPRICLEPYNWFTNDASMDFRYILCFSFVHSAAIDRGSASVMPCMRSGAKGANSVESVWRAGGIVRVPLPLSLLHSLLLVFSFPMMTTRHRGTSTISPALHTDSTEFAPFAPDLTQGITEAEPLSMAAEWTNEKHSMYLKSMEASFVNQLYDSKQILGRRFHEDASLPSTASSGQFKVLQGGSWRNINFKRENPHINRANERHDLNANPWIQHFRSSSKQGSVTSPANEETATSTMDAAGLGRRRGIVSGSPTSSGHVHICKSRTFKEDVLCDDTEMSDQNFVDEEVKDEEESERSSNVKRLKSLESEAKYNDQMVPLSKERTIGDVADNDSVSAAQS